MPTEENEFYVYEWINKDTGEIFYVGKGSGYRWKRKTASSRNRYFNRYVQKYPNCEVTIIDGGQPVYHFLASVE